MIECPKCGKISKKDVRIYDERLRKQRIDISPINPVCKLCGSEVYITDKADGGNILIINGTCGSGKTSIAEYFAKIGWLPIDGDCAIQSLRHKTGTKEYQWNELLEEVIHEIDLMSVFTNHIVLSHIILPEDYSKYIKAFETRNMQYKFILLKPEYSSAVERCQTRICHSNVTPEKWIRHFYDILVPDNRIEVIDNTHMTVNETADSILRLL